ncbi:MAG: hypothetical protein OXH64_09315 [Rhodospirillaceae bacterium]|nr:hypothetical protein [Rhodospirillaceae bacterium]
MALRRNSNLTITMDLRELSEFRRQLRRAAPEVNKAMDKSARQAIRPLRDTIRGEAPGRRTPKIVRSRGSTTRQAIVVAGRWGRPPLPYNIAFLLQKGHRLPGGGRTTPNPFVRRGLAIGLDDYYDAFRKGINKAVKAVFPKSKWAKF